jgi:hypothetical protein
MAQTGADYTSVISPVLAIVELIQKDYSSIISSGSD